MRSLSRRQFLVLGAAAGLTTTAGVAAAAEVAGSAARRYRLAERFGLINGPDAQFPAAHWSNVEGTFTSRLVPWPVTWRAASPTPGRPPVGIMISLYGKGGSHSTAFDVLHLPDAAASVGADLVVASADGGSDSYWHRRADGSDAGRMVLDEFVPMLLRRFGELPVLLHGWSMGGYGALLAAERRPHSISAVAVASPALWVTAAATAPGAFDGRADFDANDVFSSVGALRPVATRLDCGLADPFLGSTRRLSSLMDWPHRAVYGPGAHDVGFWRSVAAGQMRFLAGAAATDAAAATGSGRRSRGASG
jgi:pimeloyl-ACP methyl ester carboxylesterase